MILLDTVFNTVSSTSIDRSERSNVETNRNVRVGRGSKCVIIIDDPGNKCSNVIVYLQEYRKGNIEVVEL